MNRPPTGVALQPPRQAAIGTDPNQADLFAVAECFPLGFSLDRFDVFQ